MQHFSKANRPSILVLALSLWFDVTCVVLQALREKNLPTIPSTIGEELTFNPFMRVQWVITWTECCTFTINITYRNACQWSIQSTMNLPTLHIPPHPTPTFHRVPSVQQHARSSDAVATMKFLREEKNSFKPRLWLWIHFVVLFDGSLIIPDLQLQNSLPSTIQGSSHPTFCQLL